MLSEPLTTTTEGPTPSDQVWFEDGNVVIRCQSTLFRVFRGILSAHSPIFTALFTIPQPERTELYSGIPVVALHDDAEDMAHFLAALHDSSFFKQPNSFFRVAALLRLGTKYDIAHIRQYAIDQLGLLFPSTLEGYDNCRQNTGWGTSGCSFEAVNLARALDVPRILPAALYAAAIRPIQEILNGYHAVQYSYELANPSDKLSCLVAREKLDKARFRLFSFLAETRVPFCERPEKCPEQRHRLHVRIAQSESRLFSFALSKPQKSLCFQCVTALQHTFAQERAALWDELPSFFDLPSWDILLAEET